MSKYYLVDLGFKKVSSIKNNTNAGYNIENIVYLELLRRGNIVNIGKVNNMEVDFVVKKENELEYYHILTLDEYGLGNIDDIKV